MRKHSQGHSAMAQDLIILIIRIPYWCINSKKIIKIYLTIPDEKTGYRSRDMKKRYHMLNVPDLNRCYN